MCTREQLETACFKTWSSGMMTLVPKSHEKEIATHYLKMLHLIFSGRGVFGFSQLRETIPVSFFWLCCLSCSGSSTGAYPSAQLQRSMLTISASAKTRMYRREKHNPIHTQDLEFPPHLTFTLWTARQKEEVHKETQTLCSTAIRQTKWRKAWFDFEDFWVCTALNL